jgi:hypothetical protein
MSPPFLCRIAIIIELGIRTGDAGILLAVASLHKH